MLSKQMSELTGEKVVSRPNAINVNNELSTDPILIANSLKHLQKLQMVNCRHLTEATEYRPPCSSPNRVCVK